MNERFQYLLERYVNGQVSPEEETELARLIKTGKYESAIHEDIAKFLATKEAQAPIEEGRVDKDQLYDRILHNLDTTTDDRSPKVWKYMRWIAAVLIVGVSVSWWYTKTEKNNAVSVTQDTHKESLKSYTNKDFIHLPDGSTVQLNDSSQLTIASDFGSNTREVTLKGEAFFDIKKDPEHPFIIHSGKVTTKVLGTAFNINARVNYVTVTVTRGVVEVGDGERIFSKLRKQQQIKVDERQMSFEKSDIEDLKSALWASKNFIFDNITVEEALVQLAERYDMKVVFVDQAIRKCRISAWFLNNESFDEVLQTVTGIRQANYTMKDNIIMINGGIPCE